MPQKVGISQVWGLNSLVFLFFCQRQARKRGGETWQKRKVESSQMDDAFGIGIAVT